ncbi:Curdlan synthase [Salipiger aestuarii]|uniref:Cellulose synthase (UDP-forming) n=1 Tax=Salipiger aestuarii TaxID=568098 RepID=A0A327XRE6_9RHOB|nr:cellulose synthase catalytic subunit [Salipiger aestuarii]EIE48728.1 Curdlan synthase [Citreicella sp. 357]KAA8605217.1 Curdlan synthase [Salipiger aestuarii]KAB2536837.1 Curdlan synthase [Salipiger aestuarii]RAK11254.1 cellulose synthase (UDP-forming) [Salipiger aestuarii]
MLPFPHLDELGSATMHLLLVIGMAGLLPNLIDTKRTLHRSLLLGVAAILALRYTWWRATETLAPLGFSFDAIASWLLFTLEALSIVGSLSAFLILSRVKLRSDEADKHARWWGTQEPRVAILIATYNEEKDVLERTIVGAKFLRHQNKEIIVCDDKRRDWLRDYCAEVGVRYFRRPTNEGQKAGNINHALDRLAEDPVVPDYVAVLDADFVPHRGFLSRTIALFHDPGVGLVQTPQHFFNADPIQHNFNLGRSYPDEQRFFFDHMQPSRDAWGIAFCCGTSSICRWEALRDIGGLNTESVTEDFMLTLALQNRGWKTVYLAEPLTEGLAPEGLKEYVTQRARWCLGLMQIGRSSLGPLAPSNLRLRDRWSVLDSILYWTTTFPFRIAAIIFPLLYWYFNIIVVDARLPDVISYFGAYYFWILLTLNLLSRGMVVPILNDVSQLLGAIPISRAAFTALFKPHGHPFTVTAKGGDRSKIVVQWRMMMPFLIGFVLTLAGLFLGIIFDQFATFEAGDGKWVILFWSLYNLVALAVTCLACIERPRRELHVADMPERAVFAIDESQYNLWITSLTMDTVRIRGLKAPITTRGSLIIQDIPSSIEAYVMADVADGLRLQLLPTDAQREALFVKFYAEGDEPGVTQVRLNSLVKDLVRRFGPHRS